MKKIMKNYIVLFLFALTIFASCDLEREIDVDLPEYQNQLVVEAYLEAGKPYRLLLTESISYFDIPQLVPIDRNRPITIVSSIGEFETTIQGLIDLDLMTEDEIPSLPPSIDEATVVITHLGVPDTLQPALFVEVDDRIVSEEDTVENVFFKFYNLSLIHI